MVCLIDSVLKGLCIIGDSITFNGTLLGLGDYEAFVFTIDESQTVDILAGAVVDTVDPALELYDPEGFLLEVDQNGGGGPFGTDPRIVRSLWKKGTYTVICYSASGAGDYRISLDVVP